MKTNGISARLQHGIQHIQYSVLCDTSKIHVRDCIFWKKFIFLIKIIRNVVLASNTTISIPTEACLALLVWKNFILPFLNGRVYSTRISTVRGLEIQGNSLWNNRTSCNSPITILHPHPHFNTFSCCCINCPVLKQCNFNQAQSNQYGDRHSGYCWSNSGTIQV